MSLKGADAVDKARIGGMRLGMGGVGAILAAISFFVQPGIWFLMIGGLFILMGVIFYTASRLVE
jgi:predicted membrane channel-forming protein YqfA (hemolysin III family)